MVFPKQIVLCDRNESLVKAWRRELDNHPDVLNVFVLLSDIFDVTADAIVSPGNSFGFDDGGLDALLVQKGVLYPGQMESLIAGLPGGELAVGNLVGIRCRHPNGRSITVVTAPTMRVPMILPEDTINPYLATLAVVSKYQRDWHHLSSIVIPGMGTGVGRVSHETCARQMIAAINQGRGMTPLPNSWVEAQNRHCDLIGITHRDLQFTHEEKPNRGEFFEPKQNHRGNDEQHSEDGHST